MDTLGIDIGTVSVKYVRFHGKGHRGTVVSKGIFPYNGEAPHLELILSQIKSKEGGLRVAIGISSQDILKKSVTIPVLPPDEVREALNWSTSKTIPTSLDEMYYDYMMLGEVEERGIRKQEACFVGAQKAFVNSLLTSFANSGFRDVMFLTDIGLVYREVVARDKDASTAVIDVGGTQTGVYIFDGTALRLVREILIAAESYSDALISGVNVFAKDRETLIEAGFRDGRITLSKPAFDKFTGEIQRTLNVFEHRYPLKPVKRILVTGRGSRIPALIDELKGYFGAGVEALTTDRDMEPEFLPAGLLAAHNEGLVNLLPEDIMSARQEAVYRKWFTVGSLAVAVALLVLSLDMIARLNTLGSGVHSEAASLAKAKEQVLALSTAAANPKYKELLPYMKEIEKRDGSFVELLKYLSSRLPAGIYLRELRLGPETPVPPGPSGTQKNTPVLEQGITDLMRSGYGQAPPKPGPSGETPQLQPEKSQWLTLTGSVYGDVDTADPALLDLVLKLSGTGILRYVDVVSKEVKIVKGRRLIDFVITGKWVPHEI